MSSLEAERAYLQKEKVSDHLGKLIDRVIREKPQDAFGLMEILSRLIKAELEPVGDALASEPMLDIAVMEEYVKKIRKLDAEPKEEGGEPVQLCQLPDFVRQAEMLSWAGVGFGALESYQIMCSLRNLADAEKEAGLEKIRFWGKVLGSEADYWVAEAQRGEGELPEGDEDMEVPGATAGANQFAFYITNDLAGSWQKLPEVRPQEIVAARAIRRILTGNAHAKVISHPYFEGNEAVLLRAQIARISADTVLCIKGFMKRDEEADPDEDPPVEENPEYDALSPAELAAPEGWTHMRKHLLQNGRTAHKELLDDLEEAEEAKLKEAMSLDPPKDEIRGLRDDELEWSIKQAGDCTEYEDPRQSNLITCVRSLTWPGAVSVANGKQFINAYVGYGLPTSEPQFYPPEPPDIQEEPEDAGDQLQPPGTEEVGDAPAEETGDE